MAENAPTIVMSFVGWWPTLEGSQELQAKIVVEFSDVVNKVSTEYERNM